MQIVFGYKFNNCQNEFNPLKHFKLDLSWTDLSSNRILYESTSVHKFHVAFI